MEALIRPVPSIVSAVRKGGGYAIRALLAGVAFWCAAAPLPALAANTDTTEAVSALFRRVETDPARLRAFLHAMPKGGDLHNHLAGAVYAESYLDWAGSGGLCVDPGTHTLSRPPCDPAHPSLAEMQTRDPGFRDAMIDALSMRAFVPHPGDASGHDHFFATFHKFDAAATGRIGEALAEEAHRAAAEHVGYLEIMWYPRVRESAALGLAHPFLPTDFPADLAAITPGIPSLLASARADTDQAMARMRQLLRCDAPDADPGCRVTIRFQTFLLRVLPPGAVFAQMAYSYALVAADPRFVGVNIVAPEDDPVALRDYDLHMRMFGFFHQAHPEVRLSLHAGELALGLVPPEALESHIREAVEIAGASRIGHGVDIASERDPIGLLREMAQRHVTVEINQTSNEQILGVHGSEHPFPLYRAHGVPLTLSTDDEGVERIDLTHEYVRAVESWKLDYPALKDMARSAVANSFLAGAPLPAGTDIAHPPSPSLLRSSDKARQQWGLEQDLAAFEKTVLAAPP
ncbi:adenosine deaminase [Acetobacteraceae bacterium KSS8]|uniref:adenosine deaminase n=1 Tax=Endosaccharibacter trunci TaxID=2812733 RepID=A0ABT1W8B8_9PROT|nr:adenosine deaminase [Acetobacteraceae bacterium KSS8]